MTNFSFSVILIKLHVTIHFKINVALFKRKRKHYISFNLKEQLRSKEYSLKAYTLLFNPFRETYHDAKIFLQQKLQNIIS